MTASKHLQHDSAVASSFGKYAAFSPQLDQHGKLSKEYITKKLLPEIIYVETHNKNHNIYNVLQSHQISGEGINCPGPTLK